MTCSKVELSVYEYRDVSKIIYFGMQHYVFLCPLSISLVCFYSQIVGLTASVGTGKAKDEEKVEKHIISLAANLDAHKIVTVVNESESLIQHTNTPEQGNHDLK